jgi:membrane fusion protein (multidrug efflux system)
MRLTILPLLLGLLLAGCGHKQEDKGKRPPPLVVPAVVKPLHFVDRVEAVGTARANEQVTLSAPVTERLLRVNFEDGGFVRAGQTIAVLAQGQENAALAEAQARAREASQQLARVQTLRSRGFATKASFDAQVAAEAAARAQAAQARASIGDRVITAPFSGYASLRQISAGAVVSAGTEIATISDLSAIKLDFPVPETLLGAISKGQQVEASAAAFPDRPFRGRIDTIDPVVDPASRSVLVRAVLPNPGAMLKPGMLLRVNIESSPRMGLAVPELAVVAQGERNFVFVIGPAKKVKQVPVVLGGRQDGAIEIRQGLHAGQQVVGEGVVKVTDGATVRTTAKPAAR